MKTRESTTIREVNVKDGGLANLANIQRDRGIGDRFRQSLKSIPRYGAIVGATAVAGFTAQPAQAYTTEVINGSTFIVQSQSASPNGSQVNPYPVYAGWVGDGYYDFAAKSLETGSSVSSVQQLNVYNLALNGSNLGSPYNLGSSSSGSSGSSGGSGSSGSGSSSTGSGITLPANLQTINGMPFLPMGSVSSPNGTQTNPYPVYRGWQGGNATSQGTYYYFPAKGYEIAYPITTVGQLIPYNVSLFGNQMGSPFNLAGVSLPNQSYVSATAYQMSQTFKRINAQLPSNESICGGLLSGTTNVGGTPVNWNYDIASQQASISSAGIPIASGAANGTGWNINYALTAIPVQPKSFALSTGQVNLGVGPNSDAPTACASGIFNFITQSNAAQLNLSIGSGDSTIIKSYNLTYPQAAIGIGITGGAIAATQASVNQGLIGWVLDFLNGPWGAVVDASTPYGMATGTLQNSGTGSSGGSSGGTPVCTLAVSPITQITQATGGGPTSAITISGKGFTPNGQVTLYLNIYGPNFSTSGGGEGTDAFPVATAQADSNGNVTINSTGNTLLQKYNPQGAFGLDSSEFHTLYFILQDGNTCAQTVPQQISI